MEVIAAAQDVFLDGELFLNVDVASEITVVSCDKVATTPFGSCILHDNRAVDVVRVFNHLGHGASTVFKPLALQGSTAFPVQNISVAKGGHLEIPEIIGAQILDQRTMGDDDDVFHGTTRVIQHLTVIFQHQPLVGVCTGEGLVESSAVLTHGDAKRSEAFLTSPVKDLERGMEAQRLR